MTNVLPFKSYECDCCGKRTVHVSHAIVSGIETYHCEECANRADPHKYAIFILDNFAGIFHGNRQQAEACLLTGITEAGIDPDLYFDHSWVEPWSDEIEDSLGELIAVN